MGTCQDHRERAEQCVAMARAADDHIGRALWLTLAQSWAQLAEQVARAENAEELADGGSEPALAVQASD